MTTSGLGPGVDARAPLLEIRGLSKRFTGTLALDGVDLDLARGEIHALLGENGAGKSTLIKILAGVYQADEGGIRVRGEARDPRLQALPIVFIHQDLGLVDTMTVAENVALLAGYPRRRGLIDWDAANRQAETALAALGSTLAPTARVGDLPAAEKSILAIARALAVEADVLVLDEPTAALPEADVARLLDVLRRLRSRGLAMIYVTHRLDEVFRIADRVTVLRDGRKVMTAKVAETDPGDLVLAIVGRRLAELQVELPNAEGQALLELEGAVFAGVGPISFSLRGGEILALVGLRGAGHDLVGRGLLGELELEAGTMRLMGQPFAPRNALGARRAGVGFVTSRRREEGLAGGLSVRENVYINPCAVGQGVFALIDRRLEQQRCSEALTRFSVRPRDPERPVATLSGGNQQKVILARAIEAGAGLLILEEPTFGVDVGAKADIYRLLVEALRKGAAVVLVSSDFEEVERIAHRALVFDRSRVAAELRRGDITIDRLTAIAGGTEAAKLAS